MNPRRRTFFAVLVMALLAAPFTVLVPSAQADPATVVLVPERIVGGPGHAGLYGWGAATMRDGSVLIGDYWNKRVLHYAVDGTYLGVFIDNANYSATGHQAPYGLAVDPDNGDVYLADTDRRQIDRYTETGVYVESYGENGKSGTTATRFKYPSRVTVRDGLVYIADTWSHRIVVWEPGQTAMSWDYGGFGTGTGQFKHPRSLAFDDAGRLYVNDSQNFRVQVFEVDLLGQTLVPVDEFGHKYDASDPTPEQDAVFRGDLRGMDVDPVGGFVYVVDGEGNRFHKFSTDGTWIDDFGSKGEGLGQFLDGGRELTIAGDGNLWIGDMPNFRVQIWSPDGTPLFLRPDPPELPDPGGFNGPRGVAVDGAGNLFVSDTYNQRVVKLQNDGTPVTEWGRRGRDDYGFNYMRMIAVDPNDGSVVVADTDNHRIKKYDNDGLFLWELGKRGAALGEFISPHGVDIAPDGTIYVADTNNARVVAVSPSGVALAAHGVDGTGFGELRRPRGVVVDDVDGRIYVADSTRDRIIVWENDGTVVSEISGPGSGDHQLSNPFDLEVDAEHVYVADSASNEVKVFAKTGEYVTKVGGGGSGLGKLKTPQGLHLDGDRLYIAERDNDRVTVVRVISDTAGPTATIDPGETLASGAVAEMTGTASDEAAVASVGVAVLDDTTGEWLQGDGSWAETRVVHEASLATPGDPTSDWTWSWIVPDAGTFTVEATAVDYAGNESVVAATTVTGVADVADPETTIVTPVNNDVFYGLPAPLSGDATDDVVVDLVELSLKDRGTNLWWNPATLTWGGYVRFPAALTAPGTSASGWTFDFDDSASPGTGDYWMSARTVDQAGKVDASPATARFLVSDGPPDSTPPETVLDVTPDQQFPSRPVTITGSTTDDIATDRVQLSLRDRATGQWWNPATSSFGAFTWFESTLATPGELSSDWSFEFDDSALPGSGDYWVQARAIDAVGNVDPTPPSNRFGVVDPSADTTPPETVLTTPTAKQEFTARPVTFSGQATDDIGVDHVELAVRDRVSGDWWNPATSSWGPFVWFTAPVVAPGAPSTDWTYDFDDTAAEGSGDYWMQVRAADGSGNLDGSPSSNRFLVSSGTSTDTVAPTTTMTSPTMHQGFAGRPVVFTGSAEDDAGVDSVQVSVRDRNTGLWWNPATGSWGSFVWATVPVDSPGAPSTTWSWAFDDSASVGSGEYWVQARAVDTSINVDGSPAAANFSITA